MNDNTILFNCYTISRLFCSRIPGTVDLYRKHIKVFGSLLFLRKTETIPCILCFLAPVFDIFRATLTNSPRNNLTGHFLPKFWHILPEISSKEIFVLKGLMNKNFSHFLFWAQLFSPRWQNCWVEYCLLWSVSTNTGYICNT